MRINVLGMGYVGTVTAACLAIRGHHVIGVDKSALKVDAIKSGRCPIVEPGMEELLKDCVDAGRLSATTDPGEAVVQADLSLICVGTPSQANGSPGLDALQAVSREIGTAIARKSSRHHVVARSTVLPGTTRNLIAPWIAAASGTDNPNRFGIAFNREFLREGSSIADFNQPSRTVVGGPDKETIALVMSLYTDLPGERFMTTLETAELAKYVDNAWHAVKVAFGNEIGQLAKAAQVDTPELMQVFLSDRKLNISAAYLEPGFAFGGSCLPKDLRAMTSLGRKLDLALPLLNSVLESNRQLLEAGIEWVIRQSKRRIAFLGASFKAGTDDVRESPYIEMIERLSGKGFEIRIFDPAIRLDRLVGANRSHLSTVLPHITELLVEDVREAIAWAEVIVVCNYKLSKSLAWTTAMQKVLELTQLPDSPRIAAERWGFLW